MATYVIPAGNMSPPFFAPAGALVTMTPASGSCRLEYTKASANNIANGSAVWVTWPKGTVTVATSDLLNDDAFVRVIPGSGAITLEVNETPRGSEVETWKRDWGGTSTIQASGAAIPMIIPSSGSMADNGAITLTTALPTIYANCYLYLPADAIVTGSAAGIYFAQMSSTTVGAVYQNTYTAGDPYIPVSPVAWATTGPGAYTQVTTTQTLRSVTVPGGSLGQNGGLRVMQLWAYPNNANNKIFRTGYGGTSFTQITVTTTLSSQTATIIKNRGVQTAQVGAGTNATGFGVASSTAPTYGSINTRLDQALIHSGTLAVATDYMVLEYATVEMLN